MARGATIQVDTTQQGVTNGHCSLQEAIYASELRATKAISSTDPDTFYSTGCIAGTGDDTIVLPSGAVFTFDHFWEGDAQNIFGPTATPLIFSKIIVEGNGATLQWVDRWSPGNSRLFAVAEAVDPGVIGGGIGRLTLRNVYVKGFHTKGGNGGPGGGGGLGAGGAIYVSGGELIAENSTFESNGAVGGNGGGDGVSGGGGGLSGSGGQGCSYSGGGGGGSRANGGKSIADVVCGADARAGGGGGGGTVYPGADAASTGGGRGGLRWGGNGGSVGRDGQMPSGPGGGGGGGGGVGFHACGFFERCHGEGADGSYGGGGGGGVGDGGHGGFGGGGGGNFTGIFTQSGGDGGFGGGGGGAFTGNAFFSVHQGRGGHFGGRADSKNGGGGGALGGAIFNHNGTVRVRNSTFYNNYVTRGVGGGGSATNGADAGGAIFSLNNTLEVTNSTFSGNQSTGSGAAVVVYRDKAGPGGGGPVNFILNNTIIANNGANECFFTGNMNIKGAGNLIMNNGSGIGQFSPCPGMVATSDPHLKPLQLNSPGNTPTMAISRDSPAANKADAGSSLSSDQRGVTRPQNGGFDIGAFEARPGEGG